MTRPSPRTSLACALLARFPLVAVSTRPGTFACESAADAAAARVMIAPILGEGIEQYAAVPPAANRDEVVGKVHCGVACVDPGRPDLTHWNQA